jgi:hypothetical protein
MLKAYPIEGNAPNWTIRMRGTSTSAWLVEGCDVWERKLSRSERDPDRLLAACIDDATGITGHPDQT